MRTSYYRAARLICLAAGFLLTDGSTAAEWPPPVDEVTVCAGDTSARDMFDDATIADIREKTGIRVSLVFDPAKAQSGGLVEGLFDGRCSALVVQGSYEDWVKTVQPERAQQVTQRVLGRTRDKTRPITLVNRGRPSQALMKVMDVLRERGRQ
jgi:hypothetical protein